MERAANALLQQLDFLLRKSTFKLFEMMLYIKVSPKSPDEDIGSLEPQVGNFCFSIWTFEENMKYGVYIVDAIINLFFTSYSLKLVTKMLKNAKYDGVWSKSIRKHFESLVKVIRNGCGWIVERGELGGVTQYRYPTPTPYPRHHTIVYLVVKCNQWNFQA